MQSKPSTLGALKESGFESRSIRDEVRANLLEAIRDKRKLFPGIVGYDDSVIPSIVNALLSRHDLLLLGLRGQAKTRICRAISEFLDEWTPVVDGAPLNDDPFRPASHFARALVKEAGDETPVVWMHRAARYQEKLATPDVSVADLIGDIDPIRASRERLDLSDERVIHYGIVPRTNRGLFCLNEIPDLQPRIQVGLLNLLEERDLQIRGFPIRLALDMIFLFTANPEDYTNRGNIITPLKDRIASQIITHYPESLEDAMMITDQEASTDRSVVVNVPDFLRETIEEIAVQARLSEHVDQTSGVSARLAIAALELLTSSVERRMVANGDPNPTARLCDLYALLPAITGKLELVYEGEQEGPNIVAERLIGKAVKSIFQEYFPSVHEDKADPEASEPLYGRVAAWFNAGNTIDVSDTPFSQELAAKFSSVDGLNELVDNYLEPESPEARIAAQEFVIEAMHQHSILSREGIGGAVRYGDMLSRMMRDL